MKKKILPIAIFCIIMSCEQKMPADLEASKSSISQRFDQINSMSVSQLDGSKVVGTYTHSISRNMGGYTISASTELTIRKDGPGDYKYQMSVTTVDEMYGGIPKVTNSSGRLNSEEVKNNEWKFDGGDLGERGAYIIIPGNGWTSSPSNITINFASGRGNSMEFKRY